MDPDEFADRLRNMNDLSGHYNVSVTELLNDTFMSGHTNLATLGDLVEVSGLQNANDFGNNPPGDEIMALHTSFRTWKEMIGAASKEWVRTRGKEQIFRELGGSQ